MEAEPGSIVSSLRRRGLEEYLPVVKKALEEHRCGTIKRREFGIREGVLYTLEELSCFRSEKTGMYTAINGTLYDLTGGSFLRLYVWRE